MRFGIEVPQDAPFPALVERWQRAEELGFDHLWVADHSADTRTDHSGDYRNLDGTWFDGWTVLAVMAKETRRIRIGALVWNPDSSTNTSRLASKRGASQRHRPRASSSRSEATGDFF